MSAELGISSGRLNGGAFSLPTPEKAEGKAKLSLANLVAPVSDDLLLLNDNLQKVRTPLSLWRFKVEDTVCVSVYFMQEFAFIARSLWRYGESILGFREKPLEKKNLPI